MDLFVKLTTKDALHHGMVFKEGLNVDKRSFVDEDCCYGGIFFCRVRDMYRWIRYKSEPITTIWDVAIPNDAKVRDMGTKLKTDKIILTNPRPVRIPVHLTGPAIQYDAFLLPWITQTEEACLAAVTKSGLALELVERKYKTEAVCFAAVSQCGDALEFVEDQTRKVCLAAVNQNGLALRFCNISDKYICLAAVRQNGLALQYSSWHTPEIEDAALQNNPYAQQFVLSQSKNTFSF